MEHHARGCRILRRVLPVVLLIVLLPQVPCGRSEARELELVLHPTYAVLGDDGTAVLPLSGWLCRPGAAHPLRPLFVRKLRGRLGVVEPSEAATTFADRARLFLVKDGKERTVDLHGPGQATLGAVTGSDGRFMTRLELPVLPRDGDGRPCATVRVRAAVQGGDDGAAVRMDVPVVGPDGLSVLSDVDDTIKVTEVLDDGAKLANTFVRPFAAVPGMAAVYRGWAAEGAAFHYVSGSPHALEGALARFLDEAGFPVGSMHLRPFDLGHQVLKWLFRDRTVEHKLAAIEAVLADFPRRRFVLVGDSTEHDPEVYGRVARRHPEQIARIFVRDVAPRPLTAERAAEAFADLPAGLWSTFTDPAALRLAD